MTFLEVIKTVAAIAAIVGVYFLFFVLPSQQQKKKEASFVQVLKMGDRVVTIGGIHGVVVDVGKEWVILQLVDGRSQLQIDKNALSAEATQRVYPKADSAKKEGKKKVVNKKK